MALLKDLFGEVLTPELQEKLPPETVKQLSKSVYLYDGENKALLPMPQYRVDEMTQSLKAENENKDAQIKTLEEKLTTGDKDLKVLKKAAEGNEALTKTIQELQDKRKEDSENWDKEKLSFIEKGKQQQKVLWLKENLMNSRVDDPDARDTLALKIQNQVGLDKLEFDDKGSIKGWDDILKPIKENKAFAGMFGQIKMAGEEHIQGDNHTQQTELEKLQTDYDNAAKTGNFALQVSLKRQITEAQNALK